MGFMGAMGKAFKAPAKAIGKLPGMGAVNKAVGKAPGMKPLQGAMGIGPSGGGGGLASKMAQLRPQPEAPMIPPQQIDAPQPMSEMQAPDQGMQNDMAIRDAQMPQVGQGAPMGAPPPQANAGMMGGLAQRFGQMGGQMRPGMGMQKPQQGNAFGRAMAAPGRAMKRMF